MQSFNYNTMAKIGIGRAKLKPTLGLRGLAKKAYKKTTSQIKSGGKKVVGAVKSGVKKYKANRKANDAYWSGEIKRDDARVRRNRVLELAKKASLKPKLKILK